MLRSGTSRLCLVVLCLVLVCHAAAEGTTAGGGAAGAGAGAAAVPPPLPLPLPLPPGGRSIAKKASGPPPPPHPSLGRRDAVAASWVMQTTTQRRRLAAAATTGNVTVFQCTFMNMSWCDVALQWHLFSFFVVVCSCWRGGRFVVCTLIRRVWLHCDSVCGSGAWHSRRGELHVLRGVSCCKVEQHPQRCVRRRRWRCGRGCRCACDHVGKLPHERRRPLCCAEESAAPFVCCSTPSRHARTYALCACPCSSLCVP